MKKFIKLKISGTAKLCWAEEVKFEFGIHFLGQKGQKSEKRKKNAKSVLTNFEKDSGHRELKFSHFIISSISRNFVS